MSNPIRQAAGVLFGFTITERYIFRIVTRWFFMLTFFAIGVVSNFRKLMEEGIGRLAIVYIVCLFGFIIWVGLFISYAFFHGMTPPVVGA